MSFICMEIVVHAMRLCYLFITSRLSFMRDNTVCVAVGADGQSYALTLARLTHGRGENVDGFAYEPGKHNMLPHPHPSLALSFCPVYCMHVSMCMRRSHKGDESYLKVHYAVGTHRKMSLLA